MSRSPKRTQTDEHARRIARAFAKGRPPPFTSGLVRYCESEPREVFVAFAGLARHLPSADGDESLAVGYLVLLQRLLECLRYRADRGYADAAELIAEFQSEVVRQIQAGEVDARVLGAIGDVLHQSKIPASPEARRETVEEPVEDDAPAPEDIRAAFDEILEGCGGDPFQAVATLMKGSHVMPVEAHGAVAGAMALDGSVPARSAAVLFLLDPEASVRSAVGEALEEVAASLTPIDVRRLIAIRSWRPERERAGVDAIVRKARAAGVDCAQWDRGGVTSIHASAIDGSASQAFLLASPSGRKARLSSLLTKRGIADAWSSHEAESRRAVERQIAEARRDIPMLAVSRAYLDRVVAHQLALGLQDGSVPPVGLLQVAETLGGADWQPSMVPFETMLAELIAEVPGRMRKPSAVTSILQNNDALPDLEAIAQSWFEDSPEVARAIERSSGASHQKLATHLLETVLAQHRQKWADMVLRTALWMREASTGGDPLCWHDLAIVAQALVEGRDMAEIGLMHSIAMRTIDVHEDTAPF